MTQPKVSYNPLYLQVKDVLLKRIVDGLYSPGQIIPSESKLAEDFGTSISTIRQAVSILVSDGILKKKQGRGTFVSEQKIRISFLSWLPETKQGEKNLTELINHFEKKNPTIEIEVIPTVYQKTKDHLLRLITNGNAPDVAQIVSHWTSFYASMGAFEPLDELLDASNLAERFEDKDMVGGIFQGKIYSVAWGLCPLSLIANKNVLAEAGIHDLECPMTLFQFKEVCIKLTAFFGNSDKYAYGLNILHDETDFLRIYTFLQAFGGGFINEKEEVIFNSAENLAGFTWLRNFVSSIRILDTDIYTIRKRFSDNKVAFITDGPWIKYQMEELTGEPFDKNFMVVLNPVYHAAHSYSWNYNHALAVCSQSQKKIYAAKFIDAITNDEDLSNFYYQRSGHLPVNSSILEQEEYQTDFFHKFALQLNHSKCLNAKNPMFEKAMVLCMDAVRKLLFEQVEIKKELDEKEYYLNMLYYDNPMFSKIPLIFKKGGEAVEV